MIDKLQSDMLNAIDGKLEERLAERDNISIEKARQQIKNMSFSEHMKLKEANPTPMGSGSEPMQQPITPDKEEKTMWTDKSTFDMSQRGQLKPGEVASFGNRNGKVTRVTGNDVHMDMGDGSTSIVKMDKLMKPMDGNKPGEEDDVLKQLGKVVSTGVQSAKSGFNKGLQDDVDQVELNRMRELAGIEETSTSGATSAGGIVSMPSIVGDTSNSSKPTNRLKTKNRLKREQKKKTRT